MDCISSLSSQSFCCLLFRWKFIFISVDGDTSLLREGGGHISAGWVRLSSVFRWNIKEDADLQRHSVKAVTMNTGSAEWVQKDRGNGQTGRLSGKVTWESGKPWLVLESELASRWSVSKSYWHPLVSRNRMGLSGMQWAARALSALPQVFFRFFFPQKSADLTAQWVALVLTPTELGV